MADGDNVQIQITANDAGASPVFNNVMARIVGIEAELRAMSAAGSTVGTSIASGAVKAKTEITGLGGAFADLDAHMRTFSVAANQFGLGADVAAVKVGALSQLIGSLGGMAPEIIAIGAAITIASAGFEFFKKSISEAATWQRDLALLGQTVKDQGGDWKSLQADVIAWADTQERTTEFSRDQAVEALRQLTETGMKLSDAMIVTRVAEDASAASGQSLVTVNHALMEAMHGRVQALTMLGIGTKQSIHDGMTFEQVLAAIEAHMGGAASAAADTYAGKVKQLGNTFEKLEQDVGAALLPALSNIVEWIREIVDEVDTAIPQIEAQFSYFGAAASQCFGVLRKYAPEIQAFFDVILASVAISAMQSAVLWLGNLRLAIIATDVWSGATLLVEAFAGALEGGLLNAIRAAIAGFIDLGAAEAFATLGLSALITGAVAGAIYAFQHLDDVIHGVQTALIDVEGAVGEAAKAVGEFSEVMWGSVPGVNAMAAALEKMGQAAEDAAKKARDAMQAADDARKNATGFTPAQQEQENAARAKLAQISRGESQPDLGDLSKGLASTMVGGPSGAKKKPKSFEQYSQAADVFAQDTEAAKHFDAILQQITGSVNKSGASVAAYTHELDQLRALDAQVSAAELRANEVAVGKIAVYEKARTAYDAYISGLKNGTPANEQQAKAVERLKKAMDEDAAAAKAAQTAHENLASTLTKISNDETKAIEGIQSFTKAWNEFAASENQKLKEDQATFEMTNAQKVAYYRTAMDSINVIDEQSLEQRKQYAQEYLSAVKALYEQEVAAYKKAVDEEQKTMDSFFTDMLEKKNGLEHAFKSMWEDLAKSAIENMTKALTASGSEFQQFMSKLFPQLKAPGAMNTGLLGALGGGSSSNAPEQQIATAATTISAASSTFTSAGATFTTAGSTFSTASGTISQAAQTMQQAAQQMSSAAQSGALGNGGNSGGFPLIPGNDSWFQDINPSDLFGTPGNEATEALNVNLAGIAGSTTLASAGINPASLGSSNSNSSWMSILMGAGAGEGIGSSSGGSPESGIWGALGGGIGEAFGGPFGEAVGSYIGSMFGPHYNATNNPDMYNANGYDQFVADLTGSTGTFNGSTVNPNAADWTAAGGTSLANQMKNWLQDNSTDESSLSPELQSLYSQLQQLGGSSDALGISSEHQGMFTLQSGQQISVQDYEQLVSQWNDLAGGNNMVPAFSVARTYPNFNVANGPTATGLVGGQTTNGTVTPSSTSSTTGTSTTTGKTNPNGTPAYPGQTNVSIDLSGSTIVGPNGLSEVAQTISQALQRLLSGEIPGGYTTSLQSRLATKGS